MSDELMLPVGIDSFEKIRNNRFYYVDKTTLIEQLLKDWKEVNLFTRPRRFGKTLNMSMLKSFFEIGTDPSLFDGLYIANNKMICDEYMGKYPIIFLSLKGVNGLSYTTARSTLCKLISSEARRLNLHLDENKLGRNEKKLLNDLLCLEDSDDSSTDAKVMYALRDLSELLFRYYGKKVIILIDEYDVPLDKAFQNGYYKEMVSLIRDFLGNAFKSNDYLEFAVLTGCLRISKESIFTGLNNFKVISIDDETYDEYFGFTEDEVNKILKDYHLEEHLTKIREWYDGYHFGNMDIYCPWDVINYVSDLIINPVKEPEAYWINSSGNDLLKRFVDKANITTKEDLERLMEGKSVKKNIRTDLTYEEIDNSIDNIWSVLYTTGYLTSNTKPVDGIYNLMIPNKEIRKVYSLKIMEWFNQIAVPENNKSSSKIIKGLLTGDADMIENGLTDLLETSISILDTKAKNEEKENFYHGFLNGILNTYAEWSVRSNEESGDGFADILLKPQKSKTGIVIEIKYARNIGDMDSACQRALTQIIEKRYDASLREDGRTDILAYGISFYKKACKVKTLKL